MHPIAAAILITWRRNGAYALRLVEELTPEQWTSQPVSGRRLNHPAWVLSHLNIYTPICTAMLRRKAFIDPIDHPFGQKSEVSEDPSVYPPAAVLASDFARLHAEAEQSLAAAGVDDPEMFASANPLERWRAVHPTVGDMLVTLMVKHESGHLGQLSAWRRAMGLGRVAM